ncbi:MAG TPA: acetate--CoA ligase family protein [Candidatus Lokiarchaeia archaeon]|nr:acetate--CoA ligase family protein [Candidatus Lokiarchaeia archaeon]
MTLIEELDPFFKPKSIAIIGASEDPLKFGNWVTATVVKSNFQGNFYLINHKAETVLGVNTYPSISAVPEDVDLVGIIVPSMNVPAVLEECVTKGVKGAIIFTSGFKEIGPEGVEREKKIIEIARKANIRLVGPNCMGIYSSATNMNMTILSAGEPGGVAFISQSGGYGAETFGTMMQKGIKFSKFISSGDKADVKDWEYLEYLRTDPDTTAIMLYIEGFEEGEGRKFFEVAKEITKEKPIFAIKIGRTVAGGRAAQSHTGALAGEDAIYDAAFKQAGIIRAGEIEELYDLIKAYTAQPLPKGNRVGMLVGSGGLGCAAVDKCVELGLQVPPLSEKNTAALRKILPEYASVSNPVDFTASGAPELFTNIDVLEDIFKDPNVDAWFFGFTGTTVAGLEEIIDRFTPLIETIDTKDTMGENPPPCVGCIGENDKLIRPFIEKMFGPLFFPTPERAIRALNALYQCYLIRENKKIEGEPAGIDADRLACKQVISEALSENRRELTEVESKKILTAYQIPSSETYLAVTPAEAVQFAEQVGYPVVLKIASPEILHKSDAGGVKLDITCEADVKRCFNEIIANARDYNPDANIAGVSVQKMLPNGIELIIGTKQDPQFGPVILFGLGGIFTELLKDISLLLVPLTLQDAIHMIEGIKTRQLLEGFRQFKPVDKDALVSILIKVSALAQDNPNIKEIDLNPIIAYPDGAIAVDARIILTDEKSDEDMIPAMQC